MQTINNCDSIITLNLTVYQTQFEINETICEGDDYLENGFNLTNVVQSGIYTLNLQAINGCDSIVTLNLIVNPVFYTNYNAVICQGEDFTDYGFAIYNVQESGVHTQNLQTINGCDSVITLNLTVNPIYETPLIAAICQGGDYIENGFNIINAQESGVHTQNLQTIMGCDSIITLNLIVYQTQFVINETICQGEDYIENGFSIINAQESNTYIHNLQATNGCDSIVTLNLTVNPIYDTTIEASICKGSSYMYNGFNLTNVQESGIYTRNLHTIEGCDSIVALNLTVNPIFTYTLNVSVCQGSSYTANGFNLTNLQESGEHILNLQTVNGCDSIIKLNLTVNPVYTTMFEASIPQGSDYTLHGFNLTNVQEGGEYVLNLLSVAGCDSTIVLNLTVTASLENMGAASLIEQYPNPAEDFVTLSLDNLKSEAELVVCDLQGRVVIRQTIAEGEKELKLDLSNLASGTYNVMITTSEGITTRKLIKR